MFFKAVALINFHFPIIGFVVTAISASSSFKRLVNPRLQKKLTDRGYELKFCPSKCSWVLPQCKGGGFWYKKIRSIDVAAEKKLI